jgi:hypothetical protein
MILERGRIAEYGDRVALANDADSRLAALLRTGLETVGDGVGANGDPNTLPQPALVGTLGT